MRYWWCDNDQRQGKEDHWNVAEFSSKSRLTKDFFCLFKNHSSAAISKTSSLMIVSQVQWLRMQSSQIPGLQVDSELSLIICTFGSNPCIISVIRNIWLHQHKLVFLSKTYSLMCILGEYWFYQSPTFIQQRGCPKVRDHQYHHLAIIENHLHHHHCNRLHEIRHLISKGVWTPIQWHPAAAEEEKKHLGATLEKILIFKQETYGPRFYNFTEVFSKKKWVIC